MSLKSLCLSVGCEMLSLLLVSVQHIAAKLHEHDEGLG